MVLQKTWSINTHNHLVFCEGGNNTLKQFAITFTWYQYLATA